MPEFQAWVLPVKGVAVAERSVGELRVLEVDQTAARSILEELEAARSELRAMPTGDLLAALGSAGRRLLDPADPLRGEAEEWLPREAGLSPPMARHLLDRMARDWTGSALARLLRSEFPDDRVLEGFVDRGEGAGTPAAEGFAAADEGPDPGLPGSRNGDVGERVRIRAEGDTLAFHVGAGNVAGVGATSLLRSLLVRSPVLLKPGRGDVVLPVLVARAVGEADPRLARALAVVYWVGGTRPVLEELALRRSRRVVVYGGMETVAELRRRLPPDTPLVAYHHRISAGAVGRGRLSEEGGARRLARQAAEAVSAYDQRGCVSPHVVWVEADGEISPRRWARFLAEALDQVAGELPPGSLPGHVASRIHQLRGAAELQAAAGRGHEVFTPEGTAWTVLYEPDFRFEAGCTGRLVRVQAVQRLEDLAGGLRGHGRLLQSMALEIRPDRRVALADQLSALGVSRVTTFRRQPWPPPWWLHDGRGPLRALVRWTTLEGDLPEAQ